MKRVWLFFACALTVARAFQVAAPEGLDPAKNCYSHRLIPGRLITVITRAAALAHYLRSTNRM